MALFCPGAAAQERTRERDRPAGTVVPSLEDLKAIGASQTAYRAQRTEDVATPQPDIDGFHKEIEPILKSVCVQCHGPDTQEAELRLDALDPDLVHGADVDWWLEVLGALSNGEMPPPDDVELSDADRSRVVEWLSQELKVASLVRRATAGHSSFRRLTRYEYNYALQDLLGLEWEFARDLPPESGSEDGFQNTSELLHMSVQQFETYRKLARLALERATVVGDQPPVLYWGVSMTDAARREWPKQAEQLEKLRKKFQDDPERQQRELEQLTARFRKPHGDTYYEELATGRTARATWGYPGAKYAFKPQSDRPETPASFEHAAIIPSGRNRRLTVELGDRVPDDGILRVRVHASRVSSDQPGVPSLQLRFGWQASNEGRAVLRVGARDIAITAGIDAPQICQWDVPLGDIYPRNSVRNISPLGGMPSPSEYIRLVNSSAHPNAIRIHYVEVAAGVYEQWPPASHQRVFGEKRHGGDDTAYAREVLTTFMSRAWRRAIAPDEVDQKLKYFLAIREDCDNLEEAMVDVLATVLSSPHFLYVTRRTDNPSSAAPNLHELATRLALFLWCSVPDQQLLDLATSGALSDPKVLTAQVQRMLADPRAQRFSEHFVHQWLDLQILEFLDFKANFPGTDPLLKEAMQQEPVALFNELLHNDSSVLDFIHADYAMVNERLATHYGLSDVYGNDFRRVGLGPGDRRGGLLTQAGLLTMNSDGSDSHPLKRGVWLLKRILNDPPPPPPPAVPQIDLADPEIARMTLKQRLEDHRNQAACRSCHAKIDPWGIAFEHYDGLGRWRDTIRGQPVDASSKLFNQQRLDGVQGLKRFLLEHRQDQFVRALVHKLTTWALGRPLTFSDRAAIDSITADARQRGDGLATIILLIATSDLFRAG